MPPLRPGLILLGAVDDNKDAAAARGWDNAPGLAAAVVAPGREGGRPLLVPGSRVPDAARGIGTRTRSRWPDLPVELPRGEDAAADPGCLLLAGACTAKSSGQRPKPAAVSLSLPIEGLFDAAAMGPAAPAPVRPREVPVIRRREMLDKLPSGRAIARPWRFGT